MESSAFGRLLGALVAPVKTFRSIAERPTWLLAFLTVCLVPVLPGVFAGPKTDWEALVRTQMEQSGMDATSEQIDQAVAVWEKLGPALTYLGPFVLAFFILLFVVAFWGAFTIVGGQPGFKRSLAVVSHAMLPLAVAALIAIPVVIAADTIDAEQLQTGGYLTSSLASFAPEDAGPVLMAFLARLDVFTIWILVLLGIGFHIVAKVKPATTAIIVVALWLVWVSFNVGLAALGTLGSGGGG